MILDTNAISALLDGDPAIEVVLSGSERHHLATVALGEYRYGLESSRKKRELTELLDELESESLVLAVDSGTARAYAAIRHELKSAGTPIPENDVWIAALARQHGLPLVSNDGHFKDVRRLRRIVW